LAIAKEKAGLSENSEVEIVSFPERKLSFDFGSGSMFSSSSDLKSILEGLKKNDILGDENILLLMPYRIDIK